MTIKETHRKWCRSTGLIRLMLCINYTCFLHPVVFVRELLPLAYQLVAYTTSDDH